MLQYQQVEVLVNERQKMFWEEAELRRLEKILPPSPHPLHRYVQTLTHGVGGCLVRWGLALQGRKAYFAAPGITMTR